MPYHERLKGIGLYSLQRRRERCCIISIWKIIQGLAPSYSNPVTSTFSGGRGRSCVISHANVGRVGTLAYNSVRWRSIRLFNSLPMHLRSISSCSVLRFKTWYISRKRGGFSLPTRIQQQPGWRILYIAVTPWWHGYHLDVAEQT